MTPAVLLIDSMGHTLCMLFSLFSNLSFLSLSLSPFLWLLVANSYFFISKLKCMHAHTWTNIHTHIYNFIEFFSPPFSPSLSSSSSLYAFLTYSSGGRRRAVACRAQEKIFHIYKWWWWWLKRERRREVYSPSTTLEILSSSLLLFLLLLFTVCRFLCMWCAYTY